MNELEYNTLVQSVIATWTESLVRRILAGALGTAILAGALLTAIRARRILLSPILATVAAGACLALAFYPAQILFWLTHVEYAVRSRFLIGLSSVLVISIAIEAIRRERLRERYALLWLTTGFAILVVVLFPELLVIFRAATGMDYWSALGAVAFIFLTLLAFHFSLTISRMHGQITKLTQRLALLDAEKTDRPARQASFNDQPEGPATLTPDASASAIRDRQGTE